MTDSLPDPGAATPQMRFELSELETFLAVVELGSFSLAAQKLHVSQPSVTSRVQRLEATLRVKLLTRTTRRVEATPEGIRLRDAAEVALKGLRDVLRDFEAAASADRHRVVVAATPMIAATLLPGIIYAYRERFTDIEVQLKDLPYDQVIANIRDGAADMGVTALDEDDPKFSFELLAEEDMLLVMPASHPLAGAESVTLDRVTEYPIMILARYKALHERLAAEYLKRGRSFHPVVATNLATLLGMLDAGNGITFLPRSMTYSNAGNARQKRVAVEVTDVRFVRRYGTVRPRNHAPSSAVLSFDRFLQQEFSKALVANGPD
ncbi:LysR family transcriptional regulator [soil metagenome]